VPGRREVHDREAPEAESETRFGVKPGAGVVGAAMDDPVAHYLDRADGRGRVAEPARGEKADEAAHQPSGRGHAAPGRAPARSLMPQSLFIL